MRFQGLESQSIEFAGPGLDGLVAEVPLSGLYNTYNVLAASAAASLLGVTKATIGGALGAFTPAFGRLETVAVEGRRFRLMLAKNPASFNEVIRAASELGGASQFLVAVNDRIADGRDVSWIWDVDFERLNQAAWVVLGGTRALDMAIRFRYGGREAPPVIAEAPGDALDACLRMSRPGDEVFVLPTYTAMLDLARGARPPRLCGALLGGGVSAGLSLRIAQLYPREMSIYGDRGNILALLDRARRRDIEVELVEVSRGPGALPDIDLFFIGGGQDQDQDLVARDLAEAKRGPLAEAVAPPGPWCWPSAAATSCSVSRYVAVSGKELPGAGLLDIHTEAGQQRSIGNVLVDADWLGDGGHHRGLREPRRPHLPRPWRRAARACLGGAPATTGRPSRGGDGGPFSAPTCTARCCPRTRTSPTVCWRWRWRAGTPAPRSARFRQTSRWRRTPAVAERVGARAARRARGPHNLSPIGGRLTVGRQPLELFI